ncbi:flavohemoglobin expression-modulating QEGLA motif protein [Nocardioides lacusdianchii]|uniref:flavohemoglobin expression-modulating QEGLA motif protein n=1 Tax=Nocardioides lacusdianchii TaxID=2783664 RepID=UPI001CCB3551|nr:tyrosine/phenylalanine carboxypeptidase domain-containing protein [Nocardioides lacusdianchii]
MSGGDSELSAADLAVDHRLALLSQSFRFLLEVTPVDADDLRDDFLEGREPDPGFTYRELDTDPDVVRAELDAIDVGEVEDPVLGQLLRAKHREMELQLDMLEARDTADFLPLSVELYGGVSPALRTQAETLLASITRTEAGDEALDAEEFLALAEDEIAHYRAEDPDLDMHAEIRTDVNGVMVSGDTLLIGPETKVQRARAQALLHHEVGTHLVTQANGSHQPIKVLGVGLAGYDETQEGLAVLAEIACGGLTAFRLRQLASRVVTVHRMIGGASFAEAHEALVADGFPESSAWTTVMRVYRSGGMTKDAIYLRGLVELLEHLGSDGSLDQLWLGKFSLRDLPLIGDLEDRGLLRPPRVLPRYLHDPATNANLARAAGTEDLSTLLEGHS